MAEVAGSQLSTASVVLLLAAGWAGVSLVVSLLGWARLAEAYGFEGEFRGRRLRFQSGGFANGAGYNRTLTLGVGEDGLYLAVAPWLRLGHPPVLVPWGDLVSAREIRAGLVRRVELGFAAAPRTRFRITPKLARRLADAAGQRWPAAG